MSAKDGYAIEPIGSVRSPVRDAVDEGWGSVEARIVLEPELRPGLRGLEQFSHVLVVVLPHFDAARDARVAPWVERIMEGYF